MNQCNKFGRKLRILSLCFILLAAVTVFAVTPFAFAEDQTVYDEAAAEESSAGILEEEPFIPPVSCTNVAPFGEPVQGAAPAYAVQAANDGAETGDGMVLSKTATANNDGTYTIQMEAYATGSKIISEVSEDIPTDIVLVLDQSGSMAEFFASVTADTWISNGFRRNSDNYSNRSNLWYKLSDGSYVQVAMERQWNKGTYTYTYIDADGQTVTNTSNGQNTVFDEVRFYKRISGNSQINRLDALKSAVTNFSNEVAIKANGEDGVAGTSDDIHHRVAIVGFSSSGYNNTELLTGNTITRGSYKGIDASDSQYFPTGYAQNGPDYYDNVGITSQQYKNALLDMASENAYTGVLTGIDSLTAYGGTQTQAGIDMANQIFANNPLEPGEKRNRVIVVFTDGVPGNYGYDSEVASNAITNANISKNTYGATVYTVGIFSGADAKSEGDQYSDNDTQKANWFMQQVSSNNGTPQSPSYYLSAENADDLNKIFQQISSNVETGGTSSTLTSSSVVKDVISPYFTLPEGTTADGITLETYACTGKNGSDYTWSKNADAMGAKASISGDQVSVTGFNFSENYVGTVTEGDKVTYRGHKLVISFKVTPKPGFLGGNNVPTNANAGIYAKEGDANAVKTFEVPTVNVPIPNITVTATDKNVYLLQNPTDDQLRAGMTVKCGNVDITDPSTLEEWQKEFVTIDTPSVSKSDGFNATADGTYTITASVSPKDDGSEEAESGTGTANINVFNPEVTFKDSQIYLGQTVENYDVNLADVQWKHGDTIADSTNMGGASAPELTYSYNPINPSEYDFKKDTGVKVTDVTIDGTPVNDCVTFKHQDCDVLGNNCQFGKGDFTDCNFIVHVKGFELTIRKEGAQPIDENQSFIFNVERLEGSNWVLVTQAVVLGNSYVTITELPIGTYRVVEDQNWSWRYNLQSVTGGVVGDMQPFANQIIFDGVNGDLSKTLIFTNTRTQTKWLNGSAFCQNYWTKDADGNWKVEKHTFPNQENN